MHRPPVARRVVSTLTALTAVLAVGALAPTPADAAVSRAACTDGGGVRWEASVTWGAVTTVDGVRRIAVDAATWTADARTVPSDVRVKTYDAAGERVQSLRWRGTFDYRDGEASRSRNPANPPSAPGRTKVVLTLGVAGDGHASCTVSVRQPGGAPSASDRYESAVHAATNAERTDRDLVALKAQACVDSFAEDQAKAMAAEQRMYHQDLGPILDACDLRMVGENVAYGYATGADVTAAWMDSPGHRANILKADHRLLGVGAAQAADGRWYAAQVFGTAA